MKISSTSMGAAAKPKAQKNAIEEYKVECLIFVPKVEKKKQRKRESLEITYGVDGVEFAEFLLENKLRVVGTEDIDWPYLVDELRYEFGDRVKQLTLGPYVDASKS